MACTIAGDATTACAARRLTGFNRSDETTKKSSANLRAVLSIRRWPGLRVVGQQLSTVPRGELDRRLAVTEPGDSAAPLQVNLRPLGVSMSLIDASPTNPAFTGPIARATVVLYCVWMFARPIRSRELSESKSAVHISCWAA